MRPRAKREQGPDFDIVGTCEWLTYVRTFDVDMGQRSACLCLF
jgi:hypothetical protein